MSSISFARGVFRRQAYPRSCCGHIIFGRNVSFGRPERGGGSSRTLLPSTPARTRFAPSPTGYVHIGSLRTALYNYLLAKATGGQFLIRVEDTDQKRLVADAEEKLFDDLKWAGLNWDEGPDIGGPYGPYKQSERLGLYKEHADKLLEEGRAYRCFCTPEELDSMKKLALEESRDPVYNGACSHISTKESAERAANGEEHCVRFKGKGASTAVHDLVYGEYKSPVGLDDFIIIKRDGFPTYHFANVVDDHLMKITHVIRGAEWLVSTPRHAALYKALGWQPPIFAHVGLLVDEKKQKLSKRFGGFTLSSWKEKGILPAALLNYVLLMGWSPLRDNSGNSEVMSMEDMIRKFHLRFTKGNVTVNQKSDFFQKAHLKQSVEQSGDDPALVGAWLSKVTTSLRNCENTRESQAVGEVHQDLGVRVGALLPGIAAQVAQEETSYLQKLSSLDGRFFNPPMDLLKRYVYLLWTVPEQAHRESLLGNPVTSQSSLVFQRVVDGSGQITQEPRNISELAARLHGLLEDIPEEKWTEGDIKQAIKPFIENIIITGPNGKTRSWGWQFLRWVVSAGAPGPSVPASMAFVGKGEILGRVSQARQVAENIELERSNT
ncbi:hypothetical protein GGS20DRAFT_588721 [Poronia punctata]|nr:hypothetical protein GGS20DRAFT_588721 [Poronia punctata]